ncbi:MAG: heme A synthase [Pedobacter sp.]|nr:MAG: heme A synthase [Pedobacter sp.]
MYTKAEQRFIRVNLISIILTLMVILAGGIVRSTGSGMGCPDWPKCFDQYIPPTHVSQLPPDYQEKFVAKRLQKNERFANFLESVGRVELADALRHDKSIAEPEPFNAAKTWTEYVNRLCGVALGISLIFTAIYSAVYRKKAPRLFILSILNIFFVGYQGWLGSIVVSTNLTQWVITVHMLLAVLILGVVIYTYHYAKYLNTPDTVIMYKVSWLKWFLFFTLAVNIFQIVMGTEVREEIDMIAKELAYNFKNTWVAKLGENFLYHRDLAIFLSVCCVIVYKMVVDRFNGKAAPLRFAKTMIYILMVQVLSGVVLSYLSLPPVAQVIHLLFSMILFGIQYYLFLLVYRAQTYAAKNI